jgi:transposase
MKVFIEADAPRVACRDHGVVVAAVPWARHGAGHTRAFDDQIAWLVTHTSKTAVVELMRIAWRTVGAIAGRVVADARAVRDPFDGLTRIGIDEISYRRGHRYLMVVVDHDTGRLVWAKAGHDRATLQEFFDLLGPERASQIRLISADAAEWIGDCALAACENATLCLDPFHICRWASQALDVVRRWVWNVLRRLGLGERAKQLKGCRYALWKNPTDLTDRQAPSSPGSPSTTTSSTGPTCSKSSSGWCSSTAAPRRSPCSTRGWGGLGDARSPRSSSSTTGSRSTGPGSSLRSRTASPTGLPRA